jgi:hypothetical protein
MTAIFLSAGVPPAPDRRGYDTADPYLIREAVSAFIEVVLGRRLIVWGGQPAITPMIWAAAKALQVPFEQCVVLYRSAFFERFFLPDDEKFARVVTVPGIADDRVRSLTQLREAMLGAFKFEAAVFIGGSDGLFEELAVFRRRWPNARVVAIPAPGGVAAEIHEIVGGDPGLSGAVDFAPRLYDLLQISPSERRGARLE